LLLRVRAIADRGKTGLLARLDRRVKAGVRLDRAAENHVTKNLAASGVKVGLRVKAVVRGKAAGRKVVVRDARKAERVRVVRAAIAVRGRVAGVSISPRISIWKS